MFCQMGGDCRDGPLPMSYCIDRPDPLRHAPQGRTRLRIMKLRHLPGRAFGGAAILLAVPRRAHSQRAVHGCEQETGVEVRTFVTDERPYAEMQLSFTAAGFAADRFVRLSDQRSDPYEAINELAVSDARYVILCHQDVRADLGAGLDDLLDALGGLDEIDRRWMVAGNAGVTSRGHVIRALRDYLGGPTADRLPQRVVTLDENFLVFNVRNRPRTTPGLSGFHLYGTDVVLNALGDGSSAYVIDFPLTHLSPGTGHETAYDVCLRQFRNAWDSRCLFRYVFTPQDVLFLSRVRVVRRVFGSARALSWVRHYRRRRAPSRAVPGE